MSAPGAYIPSHLSLPRHPKTIRLSRRLGVSIPSTVGHLHLLWYFAFEYAPDGDLTEFEPADIAEAVGWTGPEDFTEAAISTGFLDRQADRIVVHDWAEYTGKILERKARERVRMREFRRTCGVHTADVRSTNVVRTGIEERRGEEKTGEDTTTLSSPEAGNDANGAPVKVPKPPRTRSSNVAPDVPDHLNGIPWGTPLALYALWNERMPSGIPAVELMDSKRERRARLRLAEFPAREWWERAFAEVPHSPLLMGRVKNPGHEGFRATADWFMSGSKDGGSLNCVKVWEGRYRERR